MSGSNSGLIVEFNAERYFVISPFEVAITLAIAILRIRFNNPVIFGVPFDEPFSAYVLRTSF